MDLANLPESFEAALDCAASAAIERDIAPDLERALATLLRLASGRAGCQRAAVYLCDKESGSTAIRYSLPNRPSNAELCLADKVIASGKTVVVDRSKVPAKWRLDLSALQKLGIQNFAGVPVHARNGECLGAICLFKESGDQNFDKGISHLLKDTAEICASLLASKKVEQNVMIADKVIEASTEGVIAADQSGQILFWNPAAERIFGFTKDEAIGQNLSIIIPRRFHSGHSTKFAEAAKSGNARFIGKAGEFVGQHAKGYEIPIEVSLAKWGDLEGEGGFAALIRDIRDKKNLEKERADAQKFLDSVVSNIPAMIFVKDMETKKYVLVNRMAEATIGRNPDQMIGKTDLELFPEFGEKFQKRDLEAATSSRPAVFESEFKRDDGFIVNLRTTRACFRGADEEKQFVLGICENRTEIRRAEAENYRLARFDSLTGLFNRVSFSEYIYDLVATGKPFALLTFDLDRFKSINDQFGHLAGDRVLKDVANRVKLHLGSGEMLARIGGDEFVAVITGKNPRCRAEHLADAILRSLTDPFQMRGKAAYLGASMGVTLFPEDGDAVQSLRENADLALYRAKNSGRGRVCFYNHEMDEAVRSQKKLEGDLREAVTRGDIGLHYQPIICTKRGKVTSFESLARWKHKKFGWVNTGSFISLAEDCGLIERLGANLLAKACHDAKAWSPDLKVSVNLSPVQFRSGRLISDVRSALDDSGLSPDRLLLEVTERLVIEDPDSTFEQLTELREIGIKISMDDFGVGHSSLSYFGKFPFDKVKIDKSFVDQLENTPAARAIVRAVVNIGEELSMGVVAEGVETTQQAKLLRSLGCTSLQGYLFSSAVEPKDIPTLLGRISKILPLVERT